MVLPLLKLGTLALKTLSKPIAARLKKEAGLHPKFRNLIISMAQRFKTYVPVVGIGRMERGLEQLFVDQKVAMESKGTRTFVDLQFYYLHSLLSPTHVQFLKANHRMTTTVQRRIYGHATDVEIRPLNEEKAVQAAVDLLGEIFVFSVGVGALIFEVQRSSRSEAKKEELRRQEMEGMRQRDEELLKEVELLKQKLEELEQLARGQGLSGVFNFRHANTEEGKAETMHPKVG